MTMRTPPATAKNSPERGPDKFAAEVLQGLLAVPKSLPSKYFYDALGDALFQQIMASPEYYLTRCEAEIFREQTGAVAAAIGAFEAPFDLIELGAGDATKSEFLLRHLVENRADFTYMPIDISGNILRELGDRLRTALPDLAIEGLEGEYFDMLRRAAALSGRRKVILFLGSTIGNMSAADGAAFCRRLRAELRPGDLALIGFDLKKHPALVLAAYNDPAGITARFNLNLLDRINRELEADFDVSQFEHYQNYDPGTGDCKSYLVSRRAQTVRIGAATVSFAEGETIYTEISRKYTFAEIAALAAGAGFEPAGSCSDARGWFVDAIWKAV